MSSGQQQPPPPRRVTNVGSLLLTPRKNESLFTFLGKNVWSVCETRIAAPDLGLPGREGAPGVGWGRRRERRGRIGLLARPFSDPAPWVQAVRAGGRLSGPAQGSREVSGPQACSGALLARTGSVPLLLVQTLLSGPRGDIFIGAA